VVFSYGLHISGDSFTQCFQAYIFSGSFLTIAPDTSSDPGVSRMARGLVAGGSRDELA